MSEHQVLHNARGGILAVGFDEDDNLIPPQFTPDGAATTIQMNPETIHTAATYQGDDQSVIDFFARTPEDDGYGVLYNEQNKTTMLNLSRLQPVMFGLFGDMKENAYQPSLRYRLTRALLQGTTGLDDPDFDFEGTCESFKTTLAAFTDDREATEVLVIPLRFGTITSPLSDDRVDTFVWFQRENGEWWHNNITVPELATSSSSCSFESISLDISCTMLIKQPEDIQGVYFVVELLQNRVNEVTSTTVTVHKYMANPNPPLGEEKEDVLHQE